jgi:hypothetical protein
MTEIDTIGLPSISSNHPQNERLILVCLAFIVAQEAFALTVTVP